MTILGKDFDFDAIRRARQRKNQVPVDLVGELNKIAPDIAALKAGETARIGIASIAKVLNVSDTDENRTRKAVMAITAKLNNLTPKGGKWQGRTFRVISDENYIYVQRGKNVEPVERKRGGRRPGSTNKPSTDTVTATEGALVTEHGSEAASAEVQPEVANA